MAILKFTHTHTHVHTPTHTQLNAERVFNVLDTAAINKRGNLQHAGRQAGRDRGRGSGRDRLLCATFGHNAFAFYSGHIKLLDK